MRVRTAEYLPHLKPRNSTGRSSCPFAATHRMSESNTRDDLDDCRAASASGPRLAVAARVSFDKFHSDSHRRLRDYSAARHIAFAILEFRMLFGLRPA